MKQEIEGTDIERKKSNELDTKSKQEKKKSQEELDAGVKKLLRTIERTNRTIGNKNLASAIRNSNDTSFIKY